MTEGEIKQVVMGMVGACTQLTGSSQTVRAYLRDLVDDDEMWKLLDQYAPAAEAIAKAVKGASRGGFA